MRGWARGRAAGATCELREGGAGGWQGQAGLVEVRSERSRHGGWSGGDVGTQRWEGTGLSGAACLGGEES